MLGITELHPQSWTSVFILEKNSAHPEGLDRMCRPVTSSCCWKSMKPWEPQEVFFPIPGPSVSTLGLWQALLYQSLFLQKLAATCLQGGIMWRTLLCSHTPTSKGFWLVPTAIVGLTFIILSLTCNSSRWLDSKRIESWRNFTSYSNYPLSSATSISPYLLHQLLSIYLLLK